MKAAYKIILKMMDEEIKQDNSSLYNCILRDIKFRMRIEETFSEAIMCFARQIERNVLEQDDELIVAKLEDLYTKVKTILSCID